MMEYRITENYPSISPAVEDRPGGNPLEMPIAQKIALLWMRTHDKRSRIVCAEVETVTKVRPRLADFAELVALRYATIIGGNRHQLTISGTAAADLVAKDLAFQMGIHQRLDGSSTRYHCSMFCTCGEIFSLSLNQGHIESQKMRAFSRHLERVNAPGWKAPRDARTIIDDLLSKLKVGAA